VLPAGVAQGAAQVLVAMDSAREERVALARLDAEADAAIRPVSQLKQVADLWRVFELDTEPSIRVGRGAAY
jgi:hypothetical protein